jgi:hypothetical protein
VTLIASFCCRSGVVMLADSEENYGSVRKSVQKLDPREWGNFKVVVGGAGIGDLIDAFIVLLESTIVESGAESLSDFKTLVEGQLTAFYADNVSTYPSDDKRLKFIITAYAIKSKAFRSWSTRHTTLVPIQTYELAGIEDALYGNVAKRLFVPGMTLSQTTLCGTHLFGVAKATSTYVRGDTSIAIINEHGVFMESPYYVGLMEQRLRDYEEHVNQMFMKCADTSLSPHRFEQGIEHFSRKARELHKAHVEATMRLNIESDKSADDLVYNRTPLFLLMLPKEAVVDEEMIQSLRRYLVSHEGLSE